MPKRADAEAMSKADCAATAKKKQGLEGIAACA